MVFRTQEDREARSPDGCGGNLLPSNSVRGYDSQEFEGYLGYVGSDFLRILQESSVKDFEVRTVESKVEDWKWASVFIEIALRAIRRVHYEHGMWGIGRQWEMNRLKAQRINMGQGIELADERAVCAAITQEFMTSPSMTGLWIEERKDGSQEKEERYFSIDREMEYTDKSKKVDIFIRKYRFVNNEPIPIEEPSFIEAKRARRWEPEIESGMASKKESQVEKVRDDIRRLRSEMCTRSERIHCHVLVWGLCQNDSQEDHPVTFFNNFDINVRMHQLRWLPIKWDSPSLQDLQNGNIEIPKIDTALWIALAEVFKGSATRLSRS